VQRYTRGHHLLWLSFEHMSLDSQMEKNTKNCLIVSKRVFGALNRRDIDAPRLMALHIVGSGDKRLLILPTICDTQST
jgi:hypothetical protein